ncbi:hypothetical protein NIES37_61840 [Tolypothrix tenuis PCC 7101]|uniref:Uncharacterized protein n=1 Tax=Tolypothrix tenuis PCC 7101 TaxID=231146 RepID=A0A1Z4N8W8_9CYAN|nr:hypothetical protein [Aulosira sp. FACHB-113]BAZ02173.1 hypothetical protein NIES37_61840 [Tolypothrix tenuis PCC 7101]BAZ73906.1 hypothetical protein NIES50_24730 [Aulosira laxa NIES-50]
MSDIAILKQMIKATATVPLEAHHNKKQVKLIEPDLPSCIVTIHGMPNEDQVIVIKADAFQSPSTIFSGSKGECKRADFVIVADTDTKKVILCIEMKAKTKTSPEWEIIQQLKGAKCFITYCQKIGKEFWGEKNFLDTYVYRFVTIRNININKRTTREKITDAHSIPEQMLKISSPNYIQFSHLIGGKQ